ncbi:MAG: hypothetical protein ACI4D3_05345 [Lachnospiraceae bacterium]
MDLIMDASKNVILVVDDNHKVTVLTGCREQVFRRLYQEGVCRELYQRNMLTECQLNQLLNRLQ